MSRARQRPLSTGKGIIVFAPTANDIEQAAHQIQQTKIRLSGEVLVERLDEEARRRRRKDVLRRKGLVEVERRLERARERERRLERELEELRGKRVAGDKGKVGQMGGGHALSKWSSHTSNPSQPDSHRKKGKAPTSPSSSCSYTYTYYTSDSSGSSSVRHSQRARTVPEREAALLAAMAELKAAEAETRADNHRLYREVARLQEIENDFIAQGRHMVARIRELERRAKERECQDEVFDEDAGPEPAGVEEKGEGVGSSTLMKNSKGKGKGKAKVGADEKENKGKSPYARPQRLVPAAPPENKSKK